MQDIETQSHVYGKIMLLHWKKLILGAFVGLFLGSIAYVLLPSKWESVALVQIGLTAHGTLIEPLPVVIERIKLHSFKDAAAQRAGRAELSELFKGGKKIKSRKLRKTNVFEIKIQANTPELSKVAVESIVNQLIFQHEGIILDENNRRSGINKKSAYQQTQEAIRELEFRIRDIDDIIGGLQEKIDGMKIDIDSKAHVYLLSSIATYRREMYRGMDLAVRYKESLNYMKINHRPTMLVEPVVVSDNPVSPKLFFTLLIGMLIGLIFSAGFIYSRPRS
jgi:hypothetical protein